MKFQNLIPILLGFALSSVGNAMPMEELEGRQGILEFPKQIVTIIRNALIENLEILLSTTAAPRTPAPLKSQSSPPKSDNFAEQFIINNFIETTKAPVNQVFQISTTAPGLNTAPVRPQASSSVNANVPPPPLSSNSAYGSNPTLNAVQQIAQLISNPIAVPGINIPAPVAPQPIPSSVVKGILQGQLPPIPPSLLFPASNSAPGVVAAQRPSASNTEYVIPDGIDVNKVSALSPSEIEQLTAQINKNHLANNPISVEGAQQPVLVEGPSPAEIDEYVYLLGVPTRRVPTDAPRPTKVTEGVTPTPTEDFDDEASTTEAFLGVETTDEVDAESELTTTERDEEESTTVETSTSVDNEDVDEAEEAENNENN